MITLDEEYFYYCHHDDTDKLNIDEAIKFCYEKAKNIKLKAEPQVFIDIAKWLEELKATKSSDIPIIHGKEELELHDNAIRNKAIDDLMEKVSECVIFDEDWNYLLQESEQLKVSGENELK